MSVSIVVSTFGEHRWEQLARERALPSCEGQGALEVVFTHMPDGTISQARNAGAAATRGDWLVFLDADDELAPGYVEAMRRRVSMTTFAGGRHKLFTPAVSYVSRGRPQRPKFWPTVPYEDGNWLVVGTMVSAALFAEVGGFRDWGDPPGSNAYEDWALWAACQKAGAEVVKVPEAVYVAHVEETSRHRGSSHEVRVGWHYEIGRALFPERYEETWMETHGRPRIARGSARRRGARR